ncbi:hypothetical protein C7H09_11390 [Marinobacter fuscus]|uniref:Uncharacterized protein n=1 Tax=Marinobacter fuscus TaxID=2109942 RepID=A0A2T1K710_9GAMM|nr:hypothetical protein [Marinobacter fuscus]PSF05941.1 hypothetical protein C7H09_11390 [Marinobacter fuscus]
MKYSSVALLTLGVLLAGCGGGESAVDGAKEIPNRFGDNQNAFDDFSSGSTGDSGSANGLEPNQIRVSLELPRAMAPGGEATRRNLNIVTADDVRVYRTNTSGQVFDDVDYRQTPASDGSRVITFADGVPLGPDVIVEARYGSYILKALAADADRNVKVNPFSHYLVDRILWQDYSTLDLQTVQACVDNPNCLNKYVWGTLADQVHDFEIDIATGASLNQALDALEARADFRQFVQSMASYALLDADSSGRISASAADYNSVFFGLELGQTWRESRVSGAGQWGVRFAQEKPLAADNAAFLYPALTLTSFDAFNLNITSLASDIPYGRQTLIHGFHDVSGTGSPEAAFFARNAGDWGLNNHSSAPGAATLTTQAPARLLAGRTLYQTITGRESGVINGWTRNPYFLDAYTSQPLNPQAGPDRVLASYFTAGKAIALSESENQLTRGQTLEDHYVSVFELNLQRPGEAETDLEPLAGEEFHHVYLAARFGNGQPAAFESGHGQWRLGSYGNQSLGGEASLNSFTLARDGSGATGASRQSTDTWNLLNRQSRLSNGDRYMGRLGLFRTQADRRPAQNDPNFGQPDLGIGATTPNQNLLAFNLNDEVLGSGLMIAGKKLTQGELKPGRYRLQGAFVGVTPDDNRLYHLAGAELLLSGGTARLEGNAMLVQHSIRQNRVTAPAATGLSVTAGYISNPSGSVSITGADITLSGFYTESGDQLFLAVRDDTGPEQRAGLLLATLVEETQRP